MNYIPLVSILAAAFAVGMGAVGPALAEGRAIAAAMDAIARQPEAAGEIRVLLLLSLALIESLVIYAFIAFFLLQGKIGAMLELVKGAG